MTPPMSRYFAFVLASFIALVFGAGSFFLASSALSKKDTTPFAFISTTRAEDEEDEGEEEDEEEYSSQASTDTAPSSSSSKPKTKTILIPQAPVTITTWVPVTKQVPADGYDKDTDNDGLVDAIDPHPVVSERHFFTDSDGDSVPDNDDRFPEHDDFFSFPNDADVNFNGILDIYETTTPQ